MGHRWLSRSGRTRSWEQVVDALSTPTLPLNEISKLTAKASEKVLIQSRNIDGLTESFWLFTNLAYASKGKNFIKDLQSLGIELSEKDSGISALKKIADSLSDNLLQNNHISVLDEIAIDSFKLTFQNLIEDESKSLFGSSIETVQKALKKYSTTKKVSELGREFFSNYIYKSFSFVLEKELALSVSSEGRFQNSFQLQDFDSHLKTYCWEVSKIVEEYSGGWYGKHGFKGDLTDKKVTQGFIQYGVTKILREMQREVDQ